MLDGQDLGRNLSEYRPYALVLIEKVCPVAIDIGNLLSEIDITSLLEKLDLELRSDLVKHRLQFVADHGVKADSLEFPSKRRRSTQYDRHTKSAAKAIKASAIWSERRPRPSSTSRSPLTPGA